MLGYKCERATKPCFPIPSALQEEESGGREEAVSKALCVRLSWTLEDRMASPLPLQAQKAAATAAHLSS